MTGKEIYDLYTKFNCMHEIVKADMFGTAKSEGDFFNAVVDADRRDSSK